ncbi:hypothetical protein F01_500022 [Burkholderia cenocepacia]|nr:hypothetical protein F01_500022 [Burkholderia cenocepacia]
MLLRVSPDRLLDWPDRLPFVCSFSMNGHLRAKPAGLARCEHTRIAADRARLPFPDPFHGARRTAAAQVGSCR